MKRLNYNVYTKLKRILPTNLPMNMVWWYYGGHAQVVRQKKFGRRRRNVLLVNLTLKKQIFIKTLNTLQALAYMRNRFLLLNINKKYLYKAEKRFRILEQKEWIPGTFLRAFRDKPKLRDIIKNKKVVVRKLPKRFPTVLINLLPIPTDIQISEANNINVLSFSFCGITSKSFIISRFKVPFQLFKHKHLAILRSILLLNILRKTANINKKLAVLNFEKLLLNIKKYNKFSIKKMLKRRFSLKYFFKNKLKYRFQKKIRSKNKFLKKNLKKTFTFGNKNKYKQNIRYNMKNISNNRKSNKYTNVSSKMKFKKNISKSKKFKLNFNTINISKPKLNRSLKNAHRYMNYVYLKDTNFVNRVKESMKIKIPPRIFIFSKKKKKKINQHIIDDQKKFKT